MKSLFEIREDFPRYLTDIEELIINWLIIGFILESHKTRKILLVVYC